MIQMKNVVDERVVSFKLATQLKEAGFDECILGFWQHTASSSVCKGGYLNHYNSYVHRSNTEWQELANRIKDKLWKGFDAKYPNISAPTYEQVLDWLESKHLMVYVVYQGKSCCWQWFIDYGGSVQSRSGYQQRYEAYDAAIGKALKSLKENKA